MIHPLYCIVLLPNSKIREEVSELKEEMRIRYHAKHAIKSPAHITLQMPFRRKDEAEKQLLEALEKYAIRQTPFTITLDGFGCFAPKVLFVTVTNPKPIKQLHVKLKEVLRLQIGLTEKAINANIHPHMTIATRDLERSAFQSAWSEFQDRKYQASFNCRHLTLLKHNGKNWDIYKKFPFQEAHNS